MAVKRKAEKAEIVQIPTAPDLKFIPDGIKLNDRGRQIIADIKKLIDYQTQIKGLIPERIILGDNDFLYLGAKIVNKERSFNGLYYDGIRIVKKSEAV